MPIRKIDGNVYVGADFGNSFSFVVEEETEAGQLNLFSGAWTPEEEAVLEKLKKVDVLNLTPLEAMNVLNEMQNRLQE